LAALYETLDHRYLNEIGGLEQATCERICEWIWHWVEAHGVPPTVVVVQETDTARSIYLGEA
jgi:6-pyruvoyltetrahydropterin/6-carboxytetrahydropterin synthase